MGLDITSADALIYPHERGCARDDGGNGQAITPGRNEAATMGSPEQTVEKHMLNSLRNSAGSWIVKILLGMLVFSFAIWGIGDIFQGERQGPVAEVGGREVSAADFLQDYSAQLSSLSAQLGRPLTAQEAQAFGITQSVLQNTISQTAVTIHAEELGVGISDDAIASAIQSAPAFQTASGAFDLARFQQFLSNRRISEQGFVRLQREEMIRGQVMSAIGRGAHVPETLLSAMNNYRNDERSVNYFVVRANAVPVVEAPAEAVLTSYFEENKTRYAAPEYRKIGLLTMTPDTVKDIVEVTDEDIRAYYDANQNRYNQPERRTFQQLAFDDMAAARSAHEQLENGADFIELGRSLGLTDADMNLGEFTRDTLPDSSLADAAFALEEGAYSDPLQSFAVVILRAESVTPGDTKTFADVKEQVRSDLARERAISEIESLYNLVEDERSKDGSDVRSAAQKLNLSFNEYTFDRTGTGENGERIEAVADNREILELTFNGDVGVENNPVPLEDGYAFFDLLEIIPERDRSFDEVREQVTSDWIAEETRKKLRAKAEELAEKGRGGSEIADLANEANASVSELSGLKRNANPTGLPASAVSVIFTLAEDGYGTVQMPDGQTQAVFQLSGTKKAPPIEDETAQNLRDELRQNLSVDILTQYVGGLQTGYGVEVNNEAISYLTSQ